MLIVNARPLPSQVTSDETAEGPPRRTTHVGGGVTTARTGLTHTKLPTNVIMVINRVRWLHIRFDLGCLTVDCFESRCPPVSPQMTVVVSNADTRHSNRGLTLQTFSTAKV